MNQLKLHLGTTLAVAVGILGGAFLVNQVMAGEEDNPEKPGPPPMVFSGTLTDDCGVATNSGSGAYWFRITILPTAGSTVGCETIAQAPVTDGRFRVPLSAACSDSVGENPSQWVQVAVSQNENKVSDYVNVGELAPLGSVPHAANGVPSGTIAPFGGTKVPKGWLLCNGAQVSQAEYPHLHQALGTTWGSASSGKFKLPNLQGYFLRGANLTKSGPGQGRKVGGNPQADTLKEHKHKIKQKTVTHTSSGKVRDYYYKTYVDKCKEGSDGGGGQITKCSGITKNGKEKYWDTDSDGNNDHTAALIQGLKYYYRDLELPSMVVKETTTENSAKYTETRPDNQSVLYIIKI